MNDLGQEAERRQREDLRGAMRQKLWGQAVDYLRTAYSGQMRSIRIMHKKDPDTWWARDRFHFAAGMQVRNRLRENGYGERDFGIDNLDNIYVKLLEEAAAVPTREEEALTLEELRFLMNILGWEAIAAWEDEGEKFCTMREYKVTQEPDDIARLRHKLSIMIEVKQRLKDLETPVETTYGATPPPSGPDSAAE